MTKVQKAKLTVEIDKLAKQRAALVKKYHDLEAYHVSISESYGSELWAGDMSRMSRKEDEALEKIRHVEAKINVLSNFLERGFSKIAEDTLKSGIYRINGEIKDLQKEKETAEKLLEEYALLHSVIGS